MVIHIDPTLVEIRLLGPFAVYLRGRAVDQGLTGPARTLLIHLLAHAGRRHRREHLIEAVWPQERAPARSRFNTTLWRLRKFLADLPGVNLETRPDTLRLSLESRCRLDCADLVTAVGKLEAAALKLDPEVSRDLVAAVSAWRGPFAEGHDEDWVLSIRERLHNDHIRALFALMRDAGIRHRYDIALEYGERVLAEDPFRESVHCEVMWLYVLVGRRAKAISRHRQFCRMLKAELGIGPMSETAGLFDYILSGLEERPEPVAGGSPCKTVRGYEGFLNALEDSRAAVYDALRNLNV